MKKITLTLFLILIISFFYATKAHASETMLVPHLSYERLPEKKDMLDNFCTFKSEATKKKVMGYVCNLDREIYTEIVDQRRRLASEAADFIDACVQDNDTSEIFEAVNSYCQIQSPISRDKILKQFCKNKTKNSQKNYIQRLEVIVDMGAAVQKTINYNRQPELEKKHNESLNPVIYDHKIHPHVEAAYQLGVIHGFSHCSVKNFQKSVHYFQYALAKPEAFFMVAELHRLRNNIGDMHKIYQFYNDAIKLNISKAAYNLSLYMYNQLRSVKDRLLLPKTFTNKNVVYFMREATKQKVAAAYNDFPILLGRFYKKGHPAIKKILPIYMKKAVKQKFKPALYNQILFLSEKKCSQKNKKTIIKNMTYLLKKDFEGAADLLPILEQNPCYHQAAHNFLEQLQDNSRFHKENSENMQIRYLSQKLAYKAFKPYDKGISAIMHD